MKTVDKVKSYIYKNQPIWPASKDFAISFEFTYFKMSEVVSLYSTIPFRNHVTWSGAPNGESTPFRFMVGKMREKKLISS